ncbi:MAG: response regulator [Cytophagales bacterium]|nr:response regulator [Cytophagales bacterium]
MEAEIEEPKEKSKYEILYVDDEEVNLRGFKANFRKFFKVHTTISPSDAVDILKENNIQVIITDQRMPEMTGTEFLEKILPDHPDVVKIILTGFTDIAAIQDGINRCGIYKYITKPWDFEEMKTTLDKAMALYQESKDGDEHIKVLEVSNEELERKVEERTKELHEVNRQLIDSIKYAGELQRSMLPADKQLERIFDEHFLLYETKYLFSEEFIWASNFNFRNEDYSFIVLLEFEGKGLVGSLKTLIADSILGELIHDRKTVHAGDIIKYLKEDLDMVGSNELRCDIKMGALVIDNYNKSVEYAGLKQDMMYFGSNGKMQVQAGTVTDSTDDVIVHEVPYDVDGSYYLYTSGFFKQQNEDGIKFSYEKFQEMVRSVNDLDMGEQLELLQNTLGDWTRQTGLEDDLTVIGFRLPE